MGLRHSGLAMTRNTQKQTTRKKLIDAALTLSAAHGFSSLSLREVAKEAGIAPTGFYRHFRSIEELGLVLVDDVGLALRQLIREARHSFSQESGRVRGSIAVFLNYVAMNPHLFRLLLGERMGSSAAFRQALRKEIDLFVDELTDDLEHEAAREGRPIPGAALAAEAIVAIVFGVGAEALDLPKHRRPQLAERLIAEVHLVLAGARAARAPA